MPTKELLSEKDLKFLKEDFLRLKRYGADTKSIESMLRDNGVADDFFGSPKQAYAKPENAADDLRNMGQPDMGKMAEGMFGANQKDSEPVSGRGPAAKTQTVSTQEGKVPAAPARTKAEAYAKPKNAADDLRNMGQPDMGKMAEGMFGANQKDSEPTSGRGPAVKTQTVSTQEGKAYAQPENAADDLRNMGQPDFLKAVEAAFGANQKDSEPTSGRGPAVKTQTVSTQEGKASAAPSRTKVEAYAQPENAADDLRNMGQPDFLKAVEAAFGANQKDSEPASGKGPAVETQTVSTQEGEVPSAASDPMALFKVTHGTKFDPKSRVDRAKLAVINSMLAKNPELSKLSPNQFAARVYRNR